MLTSVGLRGLLGLLMFGVMSLSVAAEPAAPKKAARKETARRKIDALEERLRDAEAAAAKARSVSKGEIATGRYQLQTVGDRLVVLDTQSGETRVVDLAPLPPVQSVDVGNAWVVVTVLGNISSPRFEPTTKSR